MNGSNPDASMCAVAASVTVWNYRSCPQCLPGYQFYYQYTGRLSESAGSENPNRKDECFGQERVVTRTSAAQDLEKHKRSQDLSGKDAGGDT